VLALSAIFCLSLTLLLHFDSNMLTRMRLALLLALMSAECCGDSKLQESLAWSFEFAAQTVLYLPDELPERLALFWRSFVAKYSTRLKGWILCITLTTRKRLVLNLQAM
jgi:hypothetical protein